MALAASFRAGQPHDPVRPFRPGVDEGKTGGVDGAFEEIVPAQALRMRKRKRQLSGMNAACHACFAPCRTAGLGLKSRHIGRELAFCRALSRLSWPRSCSCAAATRPDRATRTRA